MPLLGQKTIDPAAYAYLGSDIDKQKKGRDPHDRQPESGYEDIVLRLSGFFCLLAALILLEDQSETNQQDQADANPHEVDAVPPPPDRQDRRSDERAEQRSGTVESVEIIQQGGIARHSGNICIQTCINNGYTKAEQ